MSSSLIFLFHLVSVVVLLLCNAINNASSSGSSTAIISSSSSSRHRILAARDFSRYRAISRKLRATTTQTSRTTSRSRSPPTPRPGRPRPLRRRRAAIKLRLYSAADFGIGEYIAEVELGTPPKKFKLLADTGSDLTWVKCRYRRHEVHWKGQGVFEAGSSSSSFKTVPCGSRECSEGLADLFSLVTCPRPSAPCLYNYSYQDDNLLTAFGVFGEEISTLPLNWDRDRDRASHVPTTTTTTTITRTSSVLRLPTILGCTESTTHDSSSTTDILAASDGVLGLSYNANSLGYRAATTTYGGGKFSYCLVDHLSTANVTSYLTFGSTNHHQLFTNSNTNCIVRRPQRTKLILGTVGDFYAVRVKGISVDGSMLDNIPSRVWDGTIIDSGTSLTMLATPAYEALMKAMTRALEPRFPNIGSSEDIEPFSYCFKYKHNTSTDTDGLQDSTLPRLVVHFEDGARFKPHLKSYLVDDRPGVKCVGVLDAGGGSDQDQVPPYMSIIGNILQQNFFWEFDLFRHHIRFGPSTCT